MTGIVRVLLLALLAITQTPTLGAADQLIPSPGLRAGGQGDVSGMSVGGRTLLGRSLEEINVLDYGFKCDGVTDNAAAVAGGPSPLSRIESKLLENPRGNKTIYFPPAPLPCLTSRALNIYDPPAAAQTLRNVTIRAVPGTVVLRPTTSSTASPLIINISNGANILIDGIGIDGGGQDFGVDSPAIQHFGSSNVVVDRVSFTNMRGRPVVGSQSKFSGVRRSSFNNIGNRWKTTLVPGDRRSAIVLCCLPTNQDGTPSRPVSDYPGNFVTDNSFIDIGLDSISITDASNVIVSGNRCQMDNNQVALLPTDAYQACVYTNNVSGISISNNYSYGASGNGIDLKSTTGYAVTGNTMIRSGAAGIGLFGSYGTASGNTVLDSVKWANSPFKGGISVSGVGLVGVSVTSNLIADTQSTPTQPFGVEGTAGSCTNCLFDNNRINGFATAAYGGFLTGPTVRPVSAGGTGLTGGSWVAWTPTLSATDGAATPAPVAGVTFAFISAAYEQVGKTLRGRIQVQVNDSGTRPGAITFPLPGGQSLKGSMAGSAGNVSQKQILMLRAESATELAFRPFNGGNVTTASGQFITASFEVEVQ